MPKIQCGEAEYRIVGDNGEEGDIVDYGMAATLETEDGNMLTAYVDAKEGTDDPPFTKLPGGVWIQDLTDGTKLVEVEREEVDFDGGEEEFEEEEDDEGEDSGDDEDDPDGDEDEDEIEELKAPEA